MQYQNANNSVRVTDEFMKAYVDDRDWKLKAVLTGRDAGDRSGPRHHARDRPGGLGVRRPGDAVRRHHQRLAHLPGQRAHQRQQPVLRVHAPRQQRVQPGQHQPAEVPRRGRQLRRRRVPARGRDRVHRAGDHRRQLELPHREDRAQRQGLPAARAGLREPRRPADGARPGLRLRRREGLGRGDHRPDDRRGLQAERQHRRADGSVRRLRAQPRRHAPGDPQAPRGGRRDRRRARAGRAPARPPSSPGTRPWPSARSTAIATPRPPSSLRRGRSPSSSTATPPASSPTWRWSRTRSWSAGARCRS